MGVYTDVHVQIKDQYDALLNTPIMYSALRRSV